MTVAVVRASEALLVRALAERAAEEAPAAEVSGRAGPGSTHEDLHIQEAS